MHLYPIGVKIDTGCWLQGSTARGQERRSMRISRAPQATSVYRVQPSAPATPAQVRATPRDSLCAGVE